VRPTERQVIIDSNRKRLLGMLHHPVDGASRPAFLFCHPFGEEKKSSHRAFVDIARRLAESGHGVLRFDLFGCGDSEGDLGEATINGWLKDIQAARKHLAQEFPDRPAAVLGLRLGATLAAIAAADDATVQNLVLIEPIIDGKKYFASDLRRMLIKQMMTEGASSTRREDVLQRLERSETSLDFDGFEISGSLYRELSALDLSKVTLTSARVLIVQISPRQTPHTELQELAEAYRRAGANVALQPVVMPPLWNLLDEVDSSPLADVVVTWAREVG